MRIIAGSYKGMRLEAPSGRTTRPTGDRVRESIFNTLFSLGGCENALVLDGFAGSGALGLEALSRGAQHVIFYEKNRNAFFACKKNIASLKIGKNAYSVFNRDIFASIVSSADHPFDIIFFDPPYSYSPSLILGLILTMQENGLVKKNTIIVYEHDSAYNNDIVQLAEESSLALRQVKQFGSTQVSFLKEN